MLNWSGGGRAAIGYRFVDCGRRDACWSVDGAGELQTMLDDEAAGVVRNVGDACGLQEKCLIFDRNVPGKLRPLRKYETRKPSRRRKNKAGNANEDLIYLGGQV